MNCGSLVLTQRLSLRERKKKFLRKKKLISAKENLRTYVSRPYQMPLAVL